MYREVKEELGIDIRESQNIAKINLRYLKIQSEQEDNISYYPIGIIYETFLNITANDLEEQFNKNKDLIDGEIKEIENYRDFDSDKQRTLYISFLSFELNLINDKMEKIKKSAMKNYIIKGINNPTSKVSKRCCNFQLLEQKCIEYNK